MGRFRDARAELRGEVRDVGDKVERVLHRRQSGLPARRVRLGLLIHRTETDGGGAT